MSASSSDLHPRHGGRFVIEKREDGCYDVAVYLPEDRTLSAILSWDEQGAARLEPPFADAWARAEALKLARVLRRDPKEKLVRWRA